MTDSHLKIVVGLGKTGISCVRYLVQQGCNVEVVDSRNDPPGLKELQQKFSQVPIHLGGFDVEILKQADELIVSPGVSLREPAIAKCLQCGIKIIGDVELFARAVKAPVIAITGSNGKSTVTSLVAAMAKEAGKKVKVGGNLGEPVLDLLDKDAEVYVLELSSFQLETTRSLNPSVAVVLNVSPDHMDRYKDFNEYVLVKQHIYSNCQVAVINNDDLASFANVTLPKKIISFSVSKKSDFSVIDGCLVCGEKKLLEIDELKIKGLHNVANALAALALGAAIDLPMNTMLQVLRDFSGLPHRCQWVANINDVDWYNDSKGTNVGATKSAIEGFGVACDGKIVLIVGGVGKGANFSELNEVAEKYVRTVVLIGKDAALIDKALTGANKKLHASSIQEVVAMCKQEALPGDVVLFSPACASFDMFDNFEHRGEVFMENVKTLK